MLHIVIQTCEPPQAKRFKSSCPVAGQQYYSSFPQTTQHTAAGNINPASFIFHTTRKLKSLSLSPLSFFLSLSPVHTHLSCLLLVMIHSYTKAREKTYRYAVFVLSHPHWRPECTFIKRLNQAQYSSMQQIIQINNGLASPVILLQTY